MFDCAAKCNGISLNDMIYAGPKLQLDLFNVPGCFHRNPVGIACDIKEMCLQIETEEQDRSNFQLLWRDLHPSREPDVFKFSRVVFGKKSGSMESQFVAQENAQRKTVIPLPLRQSLSKPTWTTLLTVLKVTKNEWSCTVN